MGPEFCDQRNRPHRGKSAPRLCQTGLRTTAPNYPGSGDPNGNPDRDRIDDPDRGRARCPYGDREDPTDAEELAGLPRQAGRSEQHTGVIYAWTEQEALDQAYAIFRCTTALERKRVYVRETS